MSSATHSLLPFAQATPAQRTQALHYLRARLQPYFPTLPERALARLVLEFQPTLHFLGPQVTLPDRELTQLIQYLGHAPELPPLDPPRYCPAALPLAQALYQASELTLGTLWELTHAPALRCGPQLGALLRATAFPGHLAEQVVQAQRWDLPSSPRLPPGRAGGEPALDRATVEQLLLQLGSRPDPVTPG